MFPIHFPKNTSGAIVHAMDLATGLAPRHRVPLRLPSAWPSCAQSLLRAGASWLHQGGPGGWGGDLLALPGGPRLEAFWDGLRFASPGGERPWEALADRVEATDHPWLGAASFELACFEGGLPFQHPAEGEPGMRWDGVLAAINVAKGQAELWGWEDAAPDPALALQLGGACTLSRSHFGELEPAWSAQRHQEEVRALQARILEGDFYVANLCVPFEASFQGDPVTLALARMRAACPPFGAFLQFGERRLLTFSMERLLARDGDRIWSEPIKGSAQLTGDAALDAATAAALLADPKERAEHTMIVDLVRNDLGRLAATGTVQVAALMECRVFPTVQHLVSRVEAHLGPGAGLADLLRAVLPGGSVTGAPKHAVCSHLARAEAAPRGFYCGALGWIGPKGACLDLALPIRTAQIQGERLTYWAGGGITRRSDPEKEWKELLLKTKVMNLP